MGIMSAVPTVPRNPWGIFALVANILLPGFGSLVAGGVARHMLTVVFGLLQFLLFWTLLPWAWSIVWGVMILVRSE